MPKKKPVRLPRYDITKKFETLSGSVYYNTGDPTENLILWARPATQDVIPSAMEDGSTGGHDVSFNNAALNLEAQNIVFPFNQFSNTKSAVRFPKNNAAFIEVDDEDDLSFGDGSSDTSFSFATWVLLTSGSCTLTLMNKTNEYGLHIKDQKLTGTLKDQSASAFLNFSADTSSLVQEGRFHHIAFTYNSSASETSRGKFYFDGKDIATAGQEVGSYTAMEALANNLVLADNDGNQAIEFQEAALWSGKVLTGEEVNALYEAASGLNNAQREQVLITSTGITSLPTRLS